MVAVKIQLFYTDLEIHYFPYVISSKKYSFFHNFGLKNVVLNLWGFFVQIALKT